MKDVVTSGDKRIIEKEREKIEKYQNFKREIQRLSNFKEIDVIPVVFGTLRSVAENLKKYVDNIGIKVYIHIAQKNCIIRDSKNTEKSGRMLIKEKEEIDKELLIFSYNQVFC